MGLKVVVLLNFLPAVGGGIPVMAANWCLLLLMEPGPVAEDWGTKDANMELAMEVVQKLARKNVWSTGTARKTNTL